MKNISSSFLSKIRNQIISIYGLGLSGKSARKLLEKLEIKNLYSLDDKSEEALESKRKKIKKSDTVILSPGISRNAPLFSGIDLSKKEVISEIELSYRLFEKRPLIVAVTGSNGKTTTVTLIKQILESQGLKVFLGGNIGCPFSEIHLEDSDFDVIVLELSSFQLESCFDFKADIAVFLNATFTHGERYLSFNEYFDMKLKICQNMKHDDTLFVSGSMRENLKESFKRQKNNPRLEEEAFKLVEVSEETLLKLFAQYDLSHYRENLIGNHNLVNLGFAYLVLKEVLKKKKMSLDEAKMQEFLSNCKGVKYRIEAIQNAHSFLAFNDAKSTNFDSTFKALEAIFYLEKDKSQFEKRKVYLILGGQKRGENDSLEIDEKKLFSYADQVFLIGEVTDALYEKLKNKKEQVTRSYTLRKAVDSILQEDFLGILLFSPGRASFDQYKNYEARGAEFENLLL